MKNIFLVGYRGTGKTSIGKKLAGIIKASFVDTDELIVKKAGKPIPQIFAEDGEPKFRELESQVLLDVCEQDGQVVGCGGGMVTRDINIENMKKNGTVFLLKSDAKTIFNRIYRDNNRPALTDKDPFEEIVHMLEKRKDMYEKAKNFEIDTSKDSVYDCAIRIQKILNGN
ncbi:MAG: shikimate kinase [archaeon]